MRIELVVKEQRITARFGILALRKYAEHYDLGLMESSEQLAKRGYFGIAELLHFAWLADAEICDTKPELDLKPFYEGVELVQGYNDQHYLNAFTLMLEDLTEDQLRKIHQAIHDIKFMGKRLLDDSEKKK